MTESYSLEDVRTTLFTALVSDCLDQCGFTKQALPSFIRPLDEAMVLVGRARTALFMEVYEVPAGNPYEMEIALIDSLQSNDIPVFACSNRSRIAPWGELLTTAARNRGAVGALMDGCVRDVKAIRAIGFPVFHGGIAPLDSKGRGRVMAVDVPIECAGVPVNSGDLIVGDADGIVIVPARAESEVLKLAFDKLRQERSTLQDLKRGESLAAVYARYGVL
jgi:regulator of RNase E activity RraA